MSSYFKSLKSLTDDVIYPAFQDLIRSAPDSLFLGTAIFALLTQSFPLAIFFLAMMEFGALHHVFAGFIGAVTGSNDAQPGSDVCIPGIPSPYQISIVGKILAGAAFPSGPLFFVSAAIAYLLMSVNNFKEELDELGKQNSEWKTRIPLSMVFSSLLLILICLYRFINHCENVMILLGTLLFGIGAGGIVYLIHTYLFGRDSINFLGLPLLADRAANGRPLYICAANSSNQ
jgi:hypothetical protein